jgi:predicted HD phosphohydrolase
LTLKSREVDDPTMTTLERAEAAERAMMEELERVVVKSVIYTSGDRDPRLPIDRPPDQGKLYMMGHDPRLPRMPDRPTLFDFFALRFGPTQHLMQSARLAQKNGCSEKIVLACLLHDIATAGFIRGDHGYWSAQLVEPYVDEEVTFAIRYHQALRFFPDESVGYRYPESYRRLFGADYKPEPYIERDYEYARRHPWYMSSRQICVNDLYAFDPNVRVELEEFTDIVGRNFKQPTEGLGFDASPSAHMWRTIMWPTKYL